MLADNSNRTGGEGKLTSDRLENLLRSLGPDRRRAVVEYEDLQWKLRRFFEWNCAGEAEELVDETLDRVGQKLDEHEIKDVGAFAWGVAQKVRLEADKKTKRLVQISDSLAGTGFLTAVTDTEETLNARVDQDRQFKCLRHCIQDLSENDRRLFVAYYRVDKEDAAQVREKLAASFGLNMNALRVRANRLRDRVERCAARGMAPSTAKTAPLEKAVALGTGSRTVVQQAGRQKG